MFSEKQISIPINIWVGKCGGIRGNMETVASTVAATALLGLTMIFQLGNGPLKVLQQTFLRWLITCSCIQLFLYVFPTIAGYSLLAQRSAWCNGLTTSLSCGTLYARLGEGAGGGMMSWRCYCASALHPSKYAYNFKGGSSAYVIKHDELLAINWLKFAIDRFLDRIEDK